MEEVEVKRENKLNLTDSNDIQKVTMKLAMPAIMEMTMQTLLGFADMAMVGSLGAVAIAAVGLGDMPIMTLMAIFAALGTGTTALVARYIGAKEPEKATETARQSLIVGLLSGALVSILVVFFASYIIDFMGAESETAPYAIKYITYTGATMGFLVVNVIMGGVLRGCGDTKTPMYANGLANILNIIGNFLLIYSSAAYVIHIPFTDLSTTLFLPGAGMGVGGAALSTALSRVISSLIIMYVLFSGKAPIKFSIRDKYKINMSIIKKILNIGTPAAFEQLSMRVGQMLYGRKVAMLGTVVYASHRIALTAESISFMPGFGFALAATTLVGQYLGAKKPDMSEKSGYEANKLAFLFMTALGVVLFFFPELFIRVFTRDPEIVANASLCLKLVAIAQPFLAAVMVFSGALRGAGDTRYVMINTLIGVWGIRLLGTYILIDFFHFGLLGAWIGMVADLFVRGTLNFLRFRGGKWKYIRI
ncbi:MAG: efflux family protein [Clostridia bacterium]|nr:efflux family protein [Clostridia bacterium]